MGDWRLYGGLALGAVLGCSASERYQCQTDAQCVDGQTPGTCEPDVGVCSFPDPECKSERRYGSFGGELSGQCVPSDDETSSSGTTVGPSSSGAPDPTLDPTSPSTTDPTTTGPATTTDDPTSPVSVSGGSTSDDPTSDGTTGRAESSTGTPVSTSVMTFGEGNADVDGVTRDTYLEESVPERNGGSHADFHIENDRLQVSLLAFDVSALPDGAEVVDVELDLSTESSPSIDCPVQLHVLLEAWDEGMSNNQPGVANWTQRTDASDWSSPGAGTGSFDATVVGELDSPAGGSSFTVELEPFAVQGWLDDPDTNFGLLLAADGPGPCYGWFMSSNAGDPDVRPLLRVTYL